MSSPFDEQKYKCLLEGLEVSEVKLSELFLDNEKFRIDDEFFQKKYIKAYKDVKDMNHTTIGNIIECLTDFHSNGSYETIAQNFKLLDEPNYAYMVRSTDLEAQDYETNVKYVSEHTYKFLSKSKVFGGELLINKIGTPGRTFLMPKLNRPVSLGMNLFLIRIKSKCEINEKYLWAFFNSNLGQNIIKRKINGTVPLTIDKEAIKSLYIPIINEKQQKITNDLVSLSQEKLDKSKSIYRQSEKLLLETIGLKDFKSSQEGTNIKNFKESFLSTGRLDAEYYQPKYEEIECLIKTQNHSFIGKEFSQNKKSINAESKGYNYIEIGDINVSNGAYSYNLVESSELPANAKIKSKQNDLLISKVRPNRGAVSIIQDNISNLVVSGAFTVLEEKADFKKETLFVLLRTEQYREWLLKYNVGTSYPVIKDEDILNLPIPIIDFEIQQQISVLIEQSFALRRESERLLEEAKEMVEREIEK